jgi:Icc-related predicted phosphoesterase
VLVPGNAETDTELWQACADWKGAQVLHGQAVEIDGTSFFGLGAGVPPTPFPWSFDLSEDEAAAKLESCPEAAVLVVHSPPKGYVDAVHGRHLGSRSILEAIGRKRPALVLCGHIHQCWGEEAEIGTTPVVNLGPEGRFFEV